MAIARGRRLGMRQSEFRLRVSRDRQIQPMKASRDRFATRTKGVAIRWMTTSSREVEAREPTARLGRKAGSRGRALGRACTSAAAEVVRRADLLNQAAAIQLDPSAHASVARLTAVSTEAVALWMAGEGEDVAREVGREAAAIFGQLAIQREAPLNEITKRALRWRDATREVLDEIAEGAWRHC